MAEVINRIKIEIARKRVRPKIFFEDFDRLRKGEVTEPQFKRALSLMNFALSHKEMDQVTALYTSHPGYVNYQQFLQEMNSLFLDESEASPLKAAQKQIGETTHVTVNEDTFLAIEDLKYLMANKRILLKPQFQDFDRSCSGHVTIAQFARVMTNNGLIPSNPSQLSKLTELYSDSHSGVNYRRFCDDYDNIDWNQGLPSGPLDSNDEYPRSKPELPLNLTAMRFFDGIVKTHADAFEVEEKLRAIVTMKRIRASEFFRDFDNLRKGTVNAGQFESALGMMNVNLAQADIQALLNKYRHPDGGIDYASFCKYVESAPELLDKMPDYRAEGTASTMAARKQFMDISQQELQSLHDVLQDYKQQVRTRRVNLKPMFQDFDKAQTGHVTRFQFARVLNQLSLNTVEDNLRLLYRRYLDRGNKEEVNYRDFCKDVDQPEDIFTPNNQFVPNIDAALHYRKTNYPNLQYTTQPLFNEKEFASSSTTHEAFLKRIKNAVNRNKIQLQEYLQHYDRSKSGYITKSQTIEALNTAKLPLLESEFKFLCTHYGVDSQRLNYQQLLSDLDLSIEHQSNPELSELIEICLKRLGNAIRSRRIYIKEFFQGKDKNNRGRVSDSQFRSSLAFGGLYISDSEYSALTDQFRADNNEVNYLAFCNALSRYSSDFF